MDDTSFSPEEELSAEDLAIIQAFDAQDDLMLAGSRDESAALQNNAALAFDSSGLDVENPEDMLILFANEADEDIGTMRRALQQVEQDNQANSPGLISLGRAAHKLKGTSGAMGCEAMSMIALEIEEEIQLVKEGKITFFAGLMALVHALHALELTLQSVVNDGKEDPQPLQEFLQEMKGLNTEAVQSPVSSEEAPPTRTTPLDAIETAASQATVPVDSHHLHALMSHTEQLSELHYPLQNAQRQVTQSLMELQAAYTRLRRLEGLISSVTFTNPEPSEQGRPLDGQPSSSLVARILHEALQRTGRPAQSRNRSAFGLTGANGRTSEQFLWDEMEMDRFTENRILLQSFSEAVADVATASAQLRSAFTQLDALLEQQRNLTSVVRSDALHLRSAPFSLLVNRVQRAVQKIAQDRKQSIQFDAMGETTEINQDILEILTEPLLQLIHTSVADSLVALPPSPGLMNRDQEYNIWLQARVVGNEIIIELGFSMPTPGGALEALREPIQYLQGSIAVRRNPTGGVSYQLHFPSAQGVIQGLLVRSGGQNLILSLTQVQSIDYKRQQAYEKIYNLNSLMGSTGPLIDSLAPVILLANSTRHVGIQVEEIIGEIEVVVRPLPAHLQRPGISGSAIDGAGNILLIIDLPALIMHGAAQQRRAHTQPTLTNLPAATAATNPVNSQVKILMADDSVFIRQSLRQTFERANYEVIEARDGMEALEYLTSNQKPDILLLDIEMPNLNGYDLLNILHSQPGLSDCKAILLTSRSSEKHRQRAMELGAYAFLAKPCPQDLLLETVQRALADTHVSF